MRAGREREKKRGDRIRKIDAMITNSYKFKEIFFNFFMNRKSATCTL